MGTTFGCSSNVVGAASPSSMHPPMHLPQHQQQQPMQPTPSNVMVTSSHMVTSLDEECTTMPVHHIDTHKLINNGQDEAFFANNKILVNSGHHEQQPTSVSQI